MNIPLSANGMLPNEGIQFKFYPRPSSALTQMLNSLTIVEFRKEIHRYEYDYY